MDSVSEENVDKLLKEHHLKQDELNRIKETTIQQMWLSELDILENEYREYQKEREQAQQGDTKKKKTVTKVAGGAKKVVKKINIDVFEEKEKEKEIIITPKKKIVKKTIA